MLNELGGEADATEDAFAPTETDGPGPETDGLDGPHGEAGEDHAALELEDLEHEGRTYQVPKALKGAFLRQADYTRKTQELAAERRSLEAARADDAAALEARTGLATIEQRLASFEDIDWDALARTDPEGAGALRDHMENLIEAHAALNEDLELLRSERQAEAERRHLASLQAGHAELTRDLPGWSPQLAERLSTFAMSEFGVTPDELEEIADPRVVKLLHAAYAAANRDGLSAGAQRHLRAQGSRPAATVSGRGGVKDPSRMSTDEWMRHRNKQLRDGR